MLNDTTLKSKTNTWQSNHEWKLETINQSIYIENMSQNTWSWEFKKTDKVVADDFD